MNKELIELITTEIAKRKKAIEVAKAELVGLEASLARQLGEGIGGTFGSLKVYWPERRKRGNEPARQFFELCERLEIDPTRYGHFNFMPDYKAIEKGLDRGEFTDAQIDEVLPPMDPKMVIRLVE